MSAHMFLVSSVLFFIISKNQVLETETIHEFNVVSALVNSLELKKNFHEGPAFG